MPSSIRAKQKVTRKYIRPKIIVEQSQNFPIPDNQSIIKPKTLISHIRKPIEVNFFKTNRFRSIHDVPEPPLRRFETPICRWFRRRRALNQLINEHKNEIKAIENRKRESFEQERLKDFIRFESLKSKLTEQTHQPFKETTVERPTNQKAVSHKDFINWDRFKTNKAAEIKNPVYEPANKYQKSHVPVKYVACKEPTYMTSPIRKAGGKYKTPIILARECRGGCVCEKPAKPPPKKSKTAYVKTYNHRESVANKCGNCFYRVCCQFYCYLTCIIIIASVVICLI